MANRSKCYKTGRIIGRICQSHPTAPQLAVWVPLMVASMHVAGFLLIVWLLKERLWLWETPDLTAYVVIVTTLGIATGVAVVLDE